MKKELIEQLFQKFENASHLYNNIECWSARDLQEILNYAKWDNFLKVIEKAKKSCENIGEEVQNHFADIGKLVALGSGSEREISDIALTRYACYLIAKMEIVLKAKLHLHKLILLFKLVNKRLLRKGLLMLKE